MTCPGAWSGGSSSWSGPSALEFWAFLQRRCCATQFAPPCWVSSSSHIASLWRLLCRCYLQPVWAQKGALRGPFSIAELRICEASVWFWLELWAPDKIPHLVRAFLHTFAEAALLAGLVFGEVLELRNSLLGDRSWPSSRSTRRP